MRRISLVLAALLAAPGCERNVPLVLTPEQQVYESLLLAHVQSFSEPVFIASATDDRWFVENTIDATLATAGSASERVPELSGMLEELYHINTVSVPLPWRPTIVNGVLLPASYAHNPRAEEVDERCLVAGARGTIGVRSSKDGRAFRPYHTVSRVAFSRDGTLALLKHGYHCALLSGANESLVLLRLEGARWVVAASVRFWIS